jgi:hypothetical protein
MSNHVHLVLTRQTAEGLARVHRAKHVVGSAETSAAPTAATTSQSA